MTDDRTRKLIDERLDAFEQSAKAFSDAVKNGARPPDRAMPVPFTKRLGAFVRRVMCLFGSHYGETWFVSMWGRRVFVKQCECGRLWYDAARLFESDIVWIPTGALGDEQAEAEAKILVHKPRPGGTP